MQVVSLTEARSNLKALFDAVFYDHDEVIIHRKGKENVVVISMEEYNALKESDYLLSTPANRKRLLDSIAEFERGATVEQPLISCD
ncbi:MAG: type II toxin-antitoxin system Phd/YefM family antitoxin [Campylobacterales bacterium]|nr:type II toxin-antitoxin system Phd/YefM family antitoxin [Campylobacterales bacterium]